MVQRSRKGDKSSSEKSQRQLKVGEEIRHLIADILLKGTFYEPSLDGVAVTISEVSISPDFSNARVYCLPLGGMDYDNVLAGLNTIAKQIQHELSQRLTIRRTPRLKFLLDESFDVAGRVSSLIQTNQANAPADDHDDYDDHDDHDDQDDQDEADKADEAGA
ncbi:MAG: 30S ribosome-binding factor RbfA [Alphaproteobacteria bacterium]|nr:30S ribosome-binding factor RbfA [Alphaproteobacteria bacterium]